MKIMHHVIVEGHEKSFVEYCAICKIYIADLKLIKKKFLIVRLKGRSPKCFTISGINYGNKIFKVFIASRKKMKKNKVLYIKFDEVKF